MDQRLVQQHRVPSLGQELVVLSDGCICCTIPDDLVITAQHSIA
jgi:G3E family GTPase